MHICVFCCTFAAHLVMWTLLAFISALCLGFYDVSKKIALRKNTVIDVLTMSVCISAVLLSLPLLLSRLMPGTMVGTHFYVPSMDFQAHCLTLIKSVIVLSSWVFGYISLKHLPISVVSPAQATRPMWTLLGALLLFNEQLNTWQWVGILLAIGTIVISAFSLQRSAFRKSAHRSPLTDHRYYIALVLAILLGACSGLYDKYLMRQYDHNAVQVYYTIYQSLMMLIVWTVFRTHEHRKGASHQPVVNKWVIGLISIFLIISDNVYMLALRDPDSLIAVVSTIRRGGAVIGLAYGLLFLQEKDPWKKVLCMAGVLAGLICLALGT